MAQGWCWWLRPKNEKKKEKKEKEKKERNKKKGGKKGIESKIREPIISMKQSAVEAATAIANEGS